MSATPDPEQASTDSDPVGAESVRETDADGAQDANVTAAEGDAADQPPVTPAELSELGGGSPPGPAAGVDLLRDVELTVTVEVGRARTRVRDLLALQDGSVVELDRQVGSPVDLLVNGRVIAHGEIVLVADQLGVRVTGLRTQGDHG